MATDTRGLYGLAGYRHAAAQIASRHRLDRHWTLLRMLAARAAYGLSSVEYAHCDLWARPFLQLGDYRTKKQTTALFDRINPKSERPAVEDKLQFHRICLAAELPVPMLHAVLSRRDTTAVADFPLVRDVGSVLALFNDGSDHRLILKPQNDALGTGVRFVLLRSGRLFDIVDEPIDRREFEQRLYTDLERDDYLVQEFIQPSPTVAALGSGKALGTFRIVTYLHGGSVTSLYALSRIPCGSNPHDNFAGGSTGNLIAKVDCATGTLGPAYGRRDSRYSRLLERFDSNPDTGQPIAGVRIPGWLQVRATAEQAALCFSRLPVLGWDIALAEHGPVIVEANSNPDIIGSQVASGVGARQLLRPLCS
jgi:hypothetical protein